MHLLIDLFPFVDVAAPVGELRFHFRIRKLQERTLPQKVIGRLQAEVGESLIVFAAQLAVDLQEAGQQVARQPFRSIRSVLEGAAGSLLASTLRDRSIASAWGPMLHRLK